MRGDSLKANREAIAHLDKLVKINVDGGDKAAAQAATVYEASKRWIALLLLACVAAGGAAWTGC